MYNHLLRVESGIMLNKVVVPKSTSLISESFMVGGLLGRLELVVEVDSTLTVATGKYLTAELWGSSTKDGVYTLFGEIGKFGQGTYAPKQRKIYGLTRDVPMFGKVKLISDDGAMTGNVSAFLHII